MRGHMLRRSQSQELNEWDLHCQKCSENVKDIVSGNCFVEIFLLLRFMSNQLEKHVNGNDIDDERVTTPRSHHVEIGQS